MLTVDDIRSVPLFSTLAVAEIDRLAETSADLHLAAGEFAVHEGGERALYAVVAGKIEVVKLVDGVERTLGWRVPGAIFGEVPLTLGTPFPGGYRAFAPSRVMRIEAQQYYALAATAPDLALKVNKSSPELDVSGSTRRNLVRHRFQATSGPLTAGEPSCRRDSSRETSRWP